MHASPTAAPAQVVPLRFTGSAAEYFPIWIVNVLLTILTLGVYSAWAKVRNQRYFYGHTRLQDSAFEYLAEPMQILRGRLIVVGFLVAWSVFASLWQWFDLVFVLLVLPALVPWVINKALVFRTRYSSLRNIRFGFRPSQREAFGVYVLLTVGSILTLGLLYPYAAYRRRRFGVERARFGTSDFAFEGRPGAFYAIYGTAALIAVGGGLLGFTLLLAAGGMRASLLTGVPSAADAEVLSSALALGAQLSFVLVALAVVVYVRTASANYVWGHTRLGSHRFRLELDYFRLLWIYASNLVLIVLTVGLMIPWARVRTARYKVERFSMLAADDLDGFVADTRREVAATGEELGTALDMDIGL